MSTPKIWSETVQQRLAAALIEHAPAGPQTESHLRVSINETAASPGKLFRARLVFATTKAHAIDETIGITLATAVEYFHVASLLLDDLPCMDDAETRRGRPCTHRVHGEATAILAALAFINRAYALVGFALVDQPAAIRLQMQSCLDAGLGSAGLVDGQARDLGFALSDRSSREVARIALAKTGAMLWLGLLFPAFLAAPSKREARALEALCLYWTLAFSARAPRSFLARIRAGCSPSVARNSGWEAFSKPRTASRMGASSCRSPWRRRFSTGARHPPSSW